jgi:oxysterol-binding protein-related protein 1/2
MNEPLLNNSSDSSSSSSFGSDLEDSFLRACRNGDLVQVKELLAKKDSGYELNLSCKGKARSNFGWTPLHLATYFGHKDVMEILLNRQVEINSLNENGDTALHKASFIGREDLVMLLLQHNADVNIINGEGRLPRDMTPSNEIGQEIAKLLRAAEATESLKKECKLLNAAREGNVDLLKSLVSAKIWHLSRFH